MERSEFLTRSAFAVILLLIGLCYWQGIGGGFIFDDTHNLKNLGAFGPIDNWRTLLLYVTSGNADPTGRPVSMLSFLWDANNWPSNATQFKKTNILIHLLNAALLFRALQLVEKKLGSNNRTALTTSVLAASIWAAHPLFVSTTLYIVQRHAMLTVTFTLLAWLSWAKVEEELANKNLRKAWIWAITGVWGMTLMAGLSKANGFLAPMLILASQIILNSGRLKVADEGRIRFIILALPSIIVASYLLLQIRHGFDLNFGRDFSLGERLLTQPRILFIYISELLVPGMGNRGFYYGDTINVSKSLYQPTSTFISILGLTSLVVFSHLWKSQFPRLSIAIQWFLIGHLVESSTIMLELYFEHRNYLPSAFIFLPIAHWIVAGKILPSIRRILIPLAPGMLIIITLNKSIIWGSPFLQAQIWEQSNKNSYRNIINSATKANSREELDESILNINNLIQENPNSINLYLGLIGSECQTFGSSNTTWERAYFAAENDNEFNVGTIDWISHAIRVSHSGSCPNLKKENIENLLGAFSKNLSIQNKGDTQSILFHLKGYLFALNGNYSQALKNYNKAVDLSPDPNFVLTQAAMLGNLGQEELAIKHILHYKKVYKNMNNNKTGMQWVHQELLDYFKYHQSELEKLEISLRKNTKSQY